MKFLLTNALLAVALVQCLIQSTAAEWPCNKCTFMNENSKAKCVVCEQGEKPAAVNAAPKIVLPVQDKNEEVKSDYAPAPPAPVQQPYGHGRIVTERQDTSWNNDWERLSSCGECPKLGTPCKDCLSKVKIPATYRDEVSGLTDQEEVVYAQGAYIEYAKPHTDDYKVYEIRRINNGMIRMREHQTGKSLSCSFDDNFKKLTRPIGAGEETPAQKQLDQYREFLASNYRLQIHDVKGDGNCFYRALSYALNDTQRYYHWYRTQTIAYMGRRTDFTHYVAMKDFIPGHLGSKSDFIKAHSVSHRADTNNGQYADEMTIQAAAERFNLHITVFDSRNLKTQTQYGEGRERHVNVGLVTRGSTEHYVYIEPMDRQASPANPLAGRLNRLSLEPAEEEKKHDPSEQIAPVAAPSKTESQELAELAATQAVIARFQREQREYEQRQKKRQEDVLLHLKGQQADHWRDITQRRSGSITLEPAESEEKKHEPQPAAPLSETEVQELAELDALMDPIPSGASSTGTDSPSIPSQSPAANSDAPSQGSLSSGWSCPACTYENEAGVPRCEMCQVESPELLSQGWSCAACHAQNPADNEFC